MAGFVEGIDRGQSTLFPTVLDEYIGDDNPVRAIDVALNVLAYKMKRVMRILGVGGLMKAMRA